MAMGKAFSIVRTCACIQFFSSPERWHNQTDQLPAPPQLSLSQ